MSQQDKIKWDKKYTQMQALLSARPPSPLVSTYAGLTPGQRALDLACGGGRHALYLAQQGFRVDAVDISTVALEALRRAAGNANITLIEADLDTFEIIKAAYDLIIKTNYLDRNLIARAQAALKPGGIMIVETYMADPGNEKPDANPDFLLAPLELHTRFDNGFDVLEYKEFWNEPHEKYRMKKQAIAAKKYSV